MLPTFREQLKERALYSEHSVHYTPSLLFERPRQVIPENQRALFNRELTDLIDREATEDFLAAHTHYDNNLSINVTGRVSPYCEYVLRDFMQAQNLSMTTLMKRDNRRSVARTARYGEARRQITSRHCGHGRSRSSA